jgi:hypothetical protein
MKQGIRKDAERWWVELGLFGTREFVRKPLDSYYQAGWQATLGYPYGNGSELSLACEGAPLFYDSRAQTGQTGAPLAGTQLRYLTQTVELGWQQQLDGSRRWRNSLRFIFESNQDNGAGFYDYAQYQIGEELRGRAGKWEFTVQASVAWFDFSNQPLSPADPEPRQRTSLRAGLRGERGLSERWRLFAAYDYESTLSNWNVEDYEASTVSAGLGLVF